MSYSLNASSNDPRVDELKRQHQRRQKRFLLAVALGEGVALAVAVFAVFALQLIDPEQGIWVLLGVAAIGAFIMSTGLVLMIRRHAREIDDVTGR